ncbi:MAG: 2-oxo acid dehydrogenase subunit E2 [Bdellovibrionales bacterium]|nr:2-oxo acid dehydrogenase subunit E2 [Bdellovibrionales bacterium]
MAKDIWRKLALQTWRSIETSRVHTFVDLPILETDRQLTARLCRATAKTLEAFPQLKAWVHGSKIVRLSQSDAFLQVHTGASELWGVWIRNADQKTVQEIDQEIRKKAETAKTTVSPLKKKIGGLVLWMPGFLLRFSMNIWLWMRAWGLARSDAFGTFSISNAGAHGGPPRIPAPNRYTPWSVQIVVGTKIQKPMVVDGQVRAQWVLPCSLSFDHRLVDGTQVGSFIHFWMDSFRNA